MAIENFDEVKTYLETNKDNEEVKTFVGGLNPITLDKVKSLVNTDKDLKSWLDSEKDTHFKKANKTWQDNNLEKEVEALYKKRHPEADPKDSEIANMKAEIEQMKKEKTRESLVNKALKTANEKSLPVELIDFIVGEDEDTTNKNIETLVNIFNKHDEALKASFLKDHDTTPPKGGEDFSDNPWLDEHFNLTKQGQIMSSKPELVNKYKSEAKKKNKKHKIY